MTAEGLQSLPYPASSDDADVPDDMKNLAEAVRSKLVMTFASAAARTSAFTAAGISPAAGMLCYRADAPGLNRYEYWNATASAWRVYGAYQDSQTLGSNAASMSLTGVPVYLRTLRITGAVRGDTGSSVITLTARIGGDSGSVYDWNLWFASNGTPGGAGATGFAAAQAQVGYMIGPGTAGRFSTFQIDIAGWDSPTGHTTGIQGVTRTGVSATSSGYISSHGHFSYFGTNALASISIFPASGNFVTGSELVVTGWE